MIYLHMRKIAEFQKAFRNGNEYQSLWSRGRKTRTVVPGPRRIPDGIFRFRLIIIFPSFKVYCYPFAAVNGVIYFRADGGGRTRAVSKESLRPHLGRIQTAGG